MVKTKKLILHEFKKLLSKYSLDKITVSQITDKCNIKRQTFYYHFNNIDDLISYGSKSYIKDIIGTRQNVEDLPIFKDINGRRLMLPREE